MRWSAPSPRRLGAGRDATPAAAGLTRHPTAGASSSISSRSPPHQRAARGDRRHDLRQGDRRPGVGGSAVRHPQRAHLRAVDPVRDAVAARPAARPRPADHQQRRGRGSARSRPSTSSPRARGDTTLTPTDYTCRRLAPASLRTRAGAPAIARGRAPCCSRTPVGRNRSPKPGSIREILRGRARGLAAAGRGGDARAARVHGSCCSSGRCSTAGFARRQADRTSEPRSGRSG